MTVSEAPTRPSTLGLCTRQIQRLRKMNVSATASADNTAKTGELQSEAGLLLSDMNPVYIHRLLERVKLIQRRQNTPDFAPCVWLFVRIRQVIVTCVAVSVP